MKSSKQKYPVETKEKAYTEFVSGKLTQREAANKYRLPEWELSKYFTKRLSLNGYPNLNY